MNPEKDKTMVQELLEFKDTIDSIIKQSFNSEDCVDVKKVRLESVSVFSPLLFNLSFRFESLQIKKIMIKHFFLYLV